MLKVLHISQSHGGVKTYINNIVKYTVDPDKYIHFLICSKDYGECDLFEEQYLLKTFARSPSLGQDIKALKDILKIIKKIKPDIIHCHSSKGGMIGRFAGKLSGIPTIFTPNGISYLGYLGLKRSFFKQLERQTQFGAYLLTVSQSEARRGIEEMGYPEKKVSFVQNFVDVPAECHRDYTFRNRVGMVGRITQQKDPLLYMQIAKRVVEKFPHIRFVLLGAGLHDHLADEVDEYIAKNNLTANILIESWNSYNNIYEFYDSLDVFVLTSLFEGLSFSLLEAMSVGVPVVVTKVDGNKDVVNDNNGTVSNSIEELTLAIEKLIVDQQRREEMGDAAYKHVKQNNNIANAASIYQKYDLLIR